MVPERPDVEEYAKLMNLLADLKDNLARTEYRLEKVVATNIRKALKDGAKVKEVDYIKILGTNTEEEQIIDKLRDQVFSLKKLIGETQATITAWQANKDLYISDSYHQIRGSVGKMAYIGEGE